MAESTVPAAMTALRDALQGRDDLASLDVQVFTGDPGSAPPRRAIALNGVTGWTQEWGAQGNLRRKETYTLRWRVRVVESGAGEDAIQAAREVAFSIVECMAAYLRTSTVHGDATNGITLDGTVRSASIKPDEMQQWYEDAARGCLIDGGIAVEATLPRS